MCNHVIHLHDSLSLNKIFHTPKIVQNPSFNIIANRLKSEQNIHLGVYVRYDIFMF